MAYCCSGCQSASTAANGAALQELLEQLLVELAVIKGLHIPLLHHAVQVIVLLLRLGLLIGTSLPSLCLHDMSISVLHSMVNAAFVPTRDGMHHASNNTSERHSRSGAHVKRHGKACHGSADDDRASPLAGGPTAGWRVPLGAELAAPPVQSLSTGLTPASSSSSAGFSSEVLSTG